MLVILSQPKSGGGGATEQKVHVSPTNVCIPATAIKSRVDNALLTNQILLGGSDFGKSPIYFRQPPFQGAACGLHPPLVVTGRDAPGILLSLM